MFKKNKLHLLLATALSLTLINLDFTPSKTSQTAWVKLGSPVQARSSGGRSGGGSFSRPSGSTYRAPSNSGSYKSGGSLNRSSGSTYRAPSNSGSYKSGRSFSPSSGSTYRAPSNSGSYKDGGSFSPSPGSTYRTPSNSGSYNRSRSHVEIKIGDDDHYVNRRTSSADGLKLLFNLLLFGVAGVIIFALVYSVLKSIIPQAKKDLTRDNDIVTISKLQIALLAQATGVQFGLSELSLRVDTNTPEGLTELLQESVLILLRHSEYWTHALSSAKSLNIAQADSVFNELSIKERSKLSSKTLTNVNGKVHQGVNIHPETESSDYIVVTLLLGTAHDRPLFTSVNTSEKVKQALAELATMPPDYLFKFEIIWSPQAEPDSLSYDELLIEYTDIVQLA